LLYSDSGQSRIASSLNDDWTGSPFDKQTTKGYCRFVGGKLMSLKNKRKVLV